MTPHKHHDFIVAWAKGYKLQSRQNQFLSWERAKNPSFGNDWQYRIDPNQGD